MYVLTIKQSISVLSICTLLYLFSPAQSIPVSIEDVQAKEISSSGTVTQKKHNQEVSQVQVGGKKTERNENVGNNDDKRGLNEKVACDATCKVKTLVSLGIAPKIAGSLVYTCKETAIDAVKCIKLGASIVKAESGGGYKCHQNGCFGIKAGKIAYETVEDGVEDWVSRYNTWWYKQENPSGFYSNSPDWLPKTRYCLSEDSSGKNYCPNGFSHSWSMWNKISKVF